MSGNGNKEEASDVQDVKQTPAELIAPPIAPANFIQQYELEGRHQENFPDGQIDHEKPGFHIKDEGNDLAQNAVVFCSEEQDILEYNWGPIFRANENSDKSEEQYMPSVLQEESQSESDSQSLQEDQQMKSQISQDDKYQYSPSSSPVESEQHDKEDQISFKQPSSNKKISNSKHIDPNTMRALCFKFLQQCEGRELSQKQIKEKLRKFSQKINVYPFLFEEYTIVYEIIKQIEEQVQLNPNGTLSEIEEQIQEDFFENHYFSHKKKQKILRMIEKELKRNPPNRIPYLQKVQPSPSKRQRKQLKAQSKLRCKQKATRRMPSRKPEAAESTYENILGKHLFEIASIVSQTVTEELKKHFSLQIPPMAPVHIKKEQIEKQVEHLSIQQCSPLPSPLKVSTTKQAHLIHKLQRSLSLILANDPGISSEKMRTHLSSIMDLCFFPPNLRESVESEEWLESFLQNRRRRNQMEGQ